jgi:hypothetical protein
MHQKTPKVNISSNERELTSDKFYQDLVTSHSHSSNSSWNQSNVSKQNYSQDWDKFVGWHSSVQHMNMNNPAVSNQWAGSLINSMYDLAEKSIFQTPCINIHLIFCLVVK